MHRINNNSPCTINMNMLQSGTWFILEKDLNNPDRSLYFIQSNLNNDGNKATCISKSGVITQNCVALGEVIVVTLVSIDTVFNIILG